MNSNSQNDADKLFKTYKILHFHHKACHYARDIVYRIDTIMLIQGFVSCSENTTWWVNATDVTQER